MAWCGGQAGTEKFAIGGTKAAKVMNLAQSGRLGPVCKSVFLINDLLQFSQVSLAIIFGIDALGMVVEGQDIVGEQSQQV